MATYTILDGNGAPQSITVPDIGPQTGANSQSVVPNTDTPFPVVGNSAAAAADSGNPVKVGALYQLTKPTYTDGQRGNLQIGSRGSLSVQLAGTDNGTPIPTDSLATIGTGALCVQPFAPAAIRKSYAAASGGISNTTTAVTMFAAVASNRTYLTSLQITAEALGTATELAIRDGAGGTVLWRIKIGTGGLPGLDIQFPVPLRGSVGTLMEVVTLTASGTGAVYVNAQGYSSTL